ncbi:GlcG/HbpS family heme-binding protein [Phyllobacterium endophyticum]|uniref:Heme-binding protein n=1 Tax=Phyllobacterium endophyticum TaxID=1149773 RepID=A0A2P7ASU3_9HYPH|nr:heme-binding protein [Phyllobacterium endophyticum]MBB3236755.1 glc operon protein GlcG [Phyllobacterium endophyticum]PSH57285.1 heme-binding protein [Phyllobacterium endophyticum]TYR40313.1 heme-binding protein [Phyllobacterium endophyticum]
MLQIPCLSHDDASRAVDVILHALKATNRSAVVAVADQQGELIVLSRLDGAPYASIQIAANKAWTASRERCPSLAIGQASRSGEAGFDMVSYGDIRYTGFGGGLPVIVGDAVIGAVAVSGLSTQEDIALAQDGVAAILKGFESKNTPA